MHFRAEMTVQLDEPLAVESGNEGEAAIGYIIVIGVNAPDLAAAAKYAHDVALRPKGTDGSFHVYSGAVIEARIERIEKSDWEPFIRENATRIDQEGVYYSTGIIFFSAEDQSDV